MLDTGYRIEGFKNLEDRGRLKGGKKNKTDTRGWRPLRFLTVKSRFTGESKRLGQALGVNSRLD